MVRRIPQPGQKAGASVGHAPPAAPSFAGSGPAWLTRWAGQVGDPSLRLKNGYAQDDAIV